MQLEIIVEFRLEKGPILGIQNLFLKKKNYLANFQNLNN